MVNYIYIGHFTRKANNLIKGPVRFKCPFLLLLYMYIHVCMQVQFSWVFRFQVMLSLLVVPLNLHPLFLPSPN